MHDYLFAHQRELGATAWTAAALDASVADTVQFAQCMRDSSATTRALQADASAAETLNVSGTPTIVVNGFVYRGSPGRDVLSSQVNSAIRRAHDAGPAG